MRLYDKACTEKIGKDELEQIASEIYEQYLSEEALQSRGSEHEISGQPSKSYFPVQLEATVKMLFEVKYADLDNNLNEYLFIEVYAFVLDKLREYFAFFKTSQAFV